MGSPYSTTQIHPWWDKQKFIKEKNAQKFTLFFNQSIGCANKSSPVENVQRSNFPGIHSVFYTAAPYPGRRAAQSQGKMLLCVNLSALVDCGISAAVKTYDV